MILRINGVVIDHEEYKGSKATIDITDSDDTGERVTTVSQDYTLTGSAYQMVYDHFILDPNGKANSFPVAILEDGCCDQPTLLFEGILKGSNVDWCFEECSVRVTFEEYTAEVQKLNCIKSTLVDDNHAGFQNTLHPRIKYCVEIRPELVQHIILIMGVILQLILAVLTPIVAVISVIISIIQAIVNAINSLGFNLGFDPGFDGNSATSILQEYQNFRDQLNERLIGCGRVHPSPFVRSYIENVCSKCGLTFQSSILNNPASDYYNTMYMYAPVSKGTFSSNNLYIFENRPIDTLVTFLDRLKEQFNAKYEIEGDTLIFERKDYFNQGTPWVSYLSLKESGFITESLCFRWRSEDAPALAEFKHQLDPLDSITVEAVPIYDDIVEWNQPFSPIQSGIKTYLIPFAPTRFRKDGIEEDVLGFYSDAPFIGPVISQYDNTVILDKHLAAVPRLLIKSPNSPLSNATVLRVQNIPNFEYNRPYWFNEDGLEPNTAYPSNHPNSNVYARFFSIDNPKVLNDLGKKFEFSFKYKCSTLQTLTTAKHVIIPIETNTEGSVGTITKLVVNLETKTISVQGVI